MNEFDSGFWRRVSRRWNDDPDRRSLGGLGACEFRVIDRAVQPTRVSWDADGLARVAPDEEPHTILSATHQAWRSFIAGEFTATRGMLTQRIRVEGEPVRLLPYTKAFNRLAAVARSVIAGDEF